jgi:NAD(P)-dependent dehydrogenase (short-subunit alcohol dehydrogenase family)
MGFPEQQQKPPGVQSAMDPVPDCGEKSYQGSGRLRGKRAIITGGDSGIGRAVAIAYAREGADVLIAYLSEDSDAKDVAQLVEDAGQRCVLVAGDLSDPAHCRAVVDRAAEEFGGIDILVSNAAYQMSQDKGLEGISTEQFDRVLKTNVYALFWLCRAAVPRMEPGSVIITTSSVQAFQPSPHLMDYAASKAAIVNFTKALGQQLTDRGIRVNSVAPGPVWTPLIPATMSEEKLESFGAQAPLGRAAQPAELAPFYVFLASQESSYMTAEVLGVTGGSPIT